MQPQPPPGGAPEPQQLDCSEGAQQASCSLGAQQVVGELEAALAFAVTADVGALPASGGRAVDISVVEPVGTGWREWPDMGWPREQTLLVWVRACLTASCLLRDGNVRKRTQPLRPGLPSNRIVSLHETRDGSVWLRTEDNQLARFFGGRSTPLVERELA